jgi:hypothetical protein
MMRRGWYCTEQALEEALGRRHVLPTLFQDVEHDEMPVDDAPQMMLLTVESEEHLVQVSGIAGLRPSPTQLGRKALANLRAPAPNALIGDDHAFRGRGSSTSRRLRLNTW